MPWTSCYSALSSCSTTHLLPADLCRWPISGLKLVLSATLVHIPAILAASDSSEPRYKFFLGTVAGEMGVQVRMKVEYQVCQFKLKPFMTMEFEANFLYSTVRQRSQKVSHGLIDLLK